MVLHQTDCFFYIITCSYEELSAKNRNIRVEEVASGKAGSKLYYPKPTEKGRQLAELLSVKTVGNARECISRMSQSMVGNEEVTQLINNYQQEKSMKRLKEIITKLFQFQ